MSIGPSVHARRQTCPATMEPSLIAQRYVTAMQPLAAYYLFVINEDARGVSRRPDYRSIPPKRSASTRVRTGLATVFRPVRRSASAA